MKVGKYEYEMMRNEAIGRQTESESESSTGGKSFVLGFQKVPDA